MKDELDKLVEPLIHFFKMALPSLTLTGSFLAVIVDKIFDQLDLKEQHRRLIIREMIYVLKEKYESKK